MKYQKIKIVTCEGDFREVKILEGCEAFTVPLDIIKKIETNRDGKEYPVYFTETFVRSRISFSDVYDKTHLKIFWRSDKIE